MIRYLPVLLLLGGCNATLEKIDASVHKYAPIVGKNLLLIADIVVTAECSPALATGTQTAINVLNVIAPNSSAATKVSNVLTQNVAVAAALCPYVSAIQTSVGAVPRGNPTQTIGG